MSVWGTRLSLDGTWPQDRQPIRYQGSHRVPTADDPRGGLLDTASISSELTADGMDDGPADDTPLPFLRISVAERIVTREDAQPGELLGTAPGMQTVILDAGQVRELRDDLTAWFHPPGTELYPTRAKLLVELPHDDDCLAYGPNVTHCECITSETLSRMVELGWLRFAGESGDGDG